MKIPAISMAANLAQQYCDAYSNRNMEAIMALFCDKSQLWGTAVDEHRKGLEAIEEQHKRDWAQSERGILQIARVHSLSSDNTWAAIDFAADITIHGTTHHLTDLRGTIIVEMVHNEWKIVHSHASFPDYRNAEGSSFPSSL